MKMKIKIWLNELNTMSGKQFSEMIAEICFFLLMLGGSVALAIYTWRVIF